MVNVAGARLVLNLKAYAASRSPDDDLTWDPPHWPQPNATTTPIGIRFASDSDSIGSGQRTEAFDLEMYAIEREYQHFGTRIH